MGLCGFWTAAVFASTAGEVGERVLHQYSRNLIYHHRDDDQTSTSRSYRGTLLFPNDESFSLLFSVGKIIFRLVKGKLNGILIVWFLEC